MAIIGFFCYSHFGVTCIKENTNKPKTISLPSQSESIKKEVQCQTTNKQYNGIMCFCRYRTVSRNQAVEIFTKCHFISLTKKGEESLVNVMFSIFI